MGGDHQMITFLPFESFQESANCLDVKRLGKQRLECVALLNTIVFNKAGWRNHPAAIMWRKYPRALYEYSEFIFMEWQSRFYENSISLEQFKEEVVKFPEERPHWLGDDTFHRSHRIALLCKKHEHYIKYFQEREAVDLLRLGLPYHYVWPREEP
jgi:hypothetical protein